MNPLESSFAAGWRRVRRYGCCLLTAWLVAACAPAPAPQSEAPAACTADDMSAQCVCAREPNSALCACLRAPPAEGCSCLIDPQSPECATAFACPSVEPSVHVKEALLLADDGRWDDARTRIQCALDVDPEYRRALKVNSQFESNYVNAMFARGSVIYTVQEGDTLGSIAQRCLGDVELFVAIARANDIARPADLVAGQRLTIPGTQSCAAPKRDPATQAGDLWKMALDAERQGDYEAAHELIVKAQNLQPENSEIASAAARITADYIAALRTAAYQRQDDLGQLQEARRIWERVLELDPQNKEAQLNRSLLESMTKQ